MAMFSVSISVLIKYPFLFQQRIARKLASVQILTVHIDRAYLVIVIGGVIVYPAAGVAARGIYGYLILAVRDLAAAALLIDGAENVEKLADALLLGVAGL